MKKKVRRYNQVLPVSCYLQDLMETIERNYRAGGVPDDQSPKVIKHSDGSTEIVPVKR